MKITAKATLAPTPNIVKVLDNGTEIMKMYFTEKGRDAFGDENGKDEIFEVSVFGREKINAINQSKEIRNSDKCEIKCFLNSRINETGDAKFYNLGLVLSSITWY
jgi:hypothetical protein